MSGMRLITPRRDERLIEGDKASQRYIKFFEEISNISNDNTTVLDGVNATLIVLGDSFTTTTTSILICTTALTVTLNGTPQNNEKVTVNRTNGEVVVLGNGRNINTQSTITLSRDKTSLDFIYSSDLDAWFIL